MRAVVPSSPDVTVETSEEYYDEEDVDGPTHVVDVDEPQALAHTDEVEVPHVPSQDMDEAPASSKRRSRWQRQRQKRKKTKPPKARRVTRRRRNREGESSAPPNPRVVRAIVLLSMKVRARGASLVCRKAQPIAAPPVPQAPPPPPPVSAACDRRAAAVVPGAAPAQVMRPQLAQTGTSAKIEGHVAQAEPSSFGELLDDSLDL